MKQPGLTLLLLILSTFPAFSQSTLSGKVTAEDTGEDLIGANVIIYIDGVYTTGSSTDFDGNYKVPLDAGQYDVEVSYVGLQSNTIKNVIIEKDQVLQLNISLPGSDPYITCCSFIHYDYAVPLHQVDETTSGLTIDKQQIMDSPVKEIKNLTLSTPEISILKF